MRIVHFSDIHAPARLALPGGLADKRLLGFLNYYLRRYPWQRWQRVADLIAHLPALQPDLVICTGDITTLGAPAEFAHAQRTLQPLLDQTAFDFLYIPGNHDAYVHSPASRAALQATFRHLNRGRWQLDALPLLHRLGPLQFLLLNQAVPVPIHGSYGALDERTRTWLAEHLPKLAADPALRTLLVGHFPLFTSTGQPLSQRRACRHIEPLQTALRDGRLAVAMCGHIHHPFLRTEANGSLEICAGSLTQTGTCSILDYDPADRRFSHHWFHLQAPIIPPRKSL